jgi:hypothetical protein
MMKLSEHLPERPLRAEDVESLAAMDGVEDVTPVSPRPGPDGAVVLHVETGERVVSYVFSHDEGVWQYDGEA